MAEDRTSWWAKLVILFGGVAIGVVATLAVTQFDPAISQPNAAASAPATDLYALLRRGQPFPQSTPPGAGTANSTTTSGLPTAETMIEGLQARLVTDPGDIEGWRMLGWSYFNLRRFHEAVAAYREAIARAPNDAEIASALGEALVRQADGKVTGEAADSFRQAIAIDPGEVHARFFLGLAKSQAGDPAGAIEDWLVLVDEAPPGADYTTDIHARIVELADEAGIDLGERIAALPSPMPAPTRDQVAAAEAMPAADRQAMVRGMVEGLESRLVVNPHDADGWVRLIRSWRVLGETARAEQALRRATEVFADDPSARDAIIGQAAGLGVVLR